MLGDSEPSGTGGVHGLQTDGGPRGVTIADGSGAHTERRSQWEEVRRLPAEGKGHSGGGGGVERGCRGQRGRQQPGVCIY